MWRTYRVSVSGTQTVAENGTTVVHAFLNAWIYDGSRGQFLSEGCIIRARCNK